jgi:hypothetical protein
MAVARPDLEAEPAVERLLFAEVAGGDDEMVDGARHGPAPLEMATAAFGDLAADAPRRL